MKIIELLNKIANGEELPKYIKYYDRLHLKKDTMLCCYANLIYKLDNDIIDLLDEVEIIEEDKKIEKINCRIFEFMHKPDKVRLLMNKINEIIDYLEDKDEQ